MLLQISFRNEPTGEGSWSGIIYPTHTIEAQFATNDTAGTPTQTLLGAIGAGIGNNAAHEVGWRLDNRYVVSGKIVAGIDMDDNSTNTYNGIGCFGTNSPWVYTRVGTDGHTSPTSLISSW